MECFPNSDILAQRRSEHTVFTSMKTFTIQLASIVNVKLVSVHNAYRRHFKLCFPFVFPNCNNEYHIDTWSIFLKHDSLLFQNTCKNTTNKIEMGMFAGPSAKRLFLVGLPKQNELATTASSASAWTVCQSSCDGRTLSSVYIFALSIVAVLIRDVVRVSHCVR